ncbi:MAG: hypothetical protein DIU80_011770 [Chloroflexota bacterium]
MSVPQTLRALRALGAVDALSVARGPLLRGIIAVPLGLALAVRLFTPAIVERLTALLGPAAAAFYPQLVGYVLLLLLDQRDEHTLRPLLVTPLPLRSYLAYRLALPLAASAAMTAVALPLTGVLALSPAAVLATALAAAPIGSILALAVAGFAANKVQGLALQKALGVVLVLPALAAFLPAPWPLLAAALPTFWPALLLSHAQHEGVVRGDVLLFSLLFDALLLAALLRRLAAVARRT